MHSSVVVFSRSVNGLQVIGPGSKVAIFFANDRTPIGFDFDWPQYKSTGKVQRVLDVAELQTRIRSNSTLGSSQEGIKVERIDCGLVDLGARKREQQSVIQAGCSVQSVQTSVGDNATQSAGADYGPITVAVVDYIPLGESVEPHAHWPLSQGSGDVSTPKGEVPKDGPSL